MRKQARIYIAQDGIAMALLSAGMPQMLLRARPQVLRTAWEPVQERSWSSLMAALSRVIAGLGDAKAVTILLSATHVRMATLPFSELFSDPSVHVSAASALIAQQYRLDLQASPQRIAVSEAQWQHHSLITALDESRAREIEKICASANLTLTGMRAAALDAWVALRTSSTVAFVEGDRCTVIRQNDNGALALQMLPFDANNSAASFAPALRSNGILDVIWPGARLPDAPDLRLLKLPLLAQPDNTNTTRMAWALLDTRERTQPDLAKPAINHLLPALLVLAAITAGMQTHRAMTLHDELDATPSAKPALASSPDKTTAQTSAPDAKPADDMQAMNALRSSLLMPWESLLDTLSVHAGAGVELLSVEPDTANGTANVAGTAPDRAAFLDYLARMRGDQLILSAIPVSDEPTAANTGTGGNLNFRLRVTWRTTP